MLRVALRLMVSVVYRVDRGQLAEVADWGGRAADAGCSPSKAATGATSEVIETQGQTFIKDAITMARFTTTGGHWSRPQGAAATDREGRIVYIGTFSRTVFPSMRIGYLIAQASLVPAFTAAKWLSDLHSAFSAEQQTLADFIARRDVRAASAAAAKKEHGAAGGYCEAIRELSGGSRGGNGRRRTEQFNTAMLAFVDEGSRKPVGRTPTDKSGRTVLEL